MNSILFVLLATVITVLALPHPQKDEIVLYESDADENGYNFQYETSDGVARVESGKIKPNADGIDSLAVEGAYTFTDDRGEQHTVKFIADENGYRLRP